MYSKFNFKPGGRTWNEFVPKGEDIFKAHRVQIEKNLDEFKNADGVLQASQIVGKWFPSIDADVFLSHAHRDEKTILGLAGWLHEEFGLRAFIDSAVWGYADDLLKAIDDAYCRNESGATYNYELRNRSTSHVHLMLSNALMDMIDRCECIMFVNTPQSFTPSAYFEERGTSESPWIYSEVQMTKFLRERPLSEYRAGSSTVYKAEVVALEALYEGMRLEYEMNTLHLAALSATEMDRWAQRWSRSHTMKTGFQKLYALDALYRIKTKVAT